MWNIMIKAVHLLLFLFCCSSTVNGFLDNPLKAAIIPATIASATPTRHTSACRNAISTCSHYGYHMCTQKEYEPWAKDNCALHCGFCRIPDTNFHCVDKIPNCSEFDDGLLCSDDSFADWAFENCMSYCKFGLCEAVCTDVDSNCALLNASISICNNIGQSRKVCQKYCGLCDIRDGQWSDWSSWGQCTQTCGNGTQLRSRKCDNPSPHHFGIDCEGPRTETGQCGEPCPVDGGWGNWQHWGDCSVSCGVGIQHRSRACDSPQPQRNGSYCSGDSSSSLICSLKSCADGGWSGWNAWTNCSASCGGGQRTRQRTCTNPTPSQYGMWCEGHSRDVEACNIVPCLATATTITKTTIQTDTTATRNPLKTTTQTATPATTNVPLTTTRTAATATTHSLITRSTTLSILQNVFCLNVDKIACNINVDIKCGSDGKIYQNECKIAKEKCRHPSLQSVPMSYCTGVTKSTTQTTTRTTTTQPTPTPATTETTPASTTNQVTTRSTTAHHVQNVFCMNVNGISCGVSFSIKCGSDGRYYANDCMLAKARCNDPSLHVAPKSSCSGQSGGLTTISSTSTTVSASTLPTSTTMVKTTVNHSNIPPPTTDHLMQVFCANKDSIQCPTGGDDSICGSDGKIYRTTCEMSKASCDDLSLRAMNPSTCSGGSTKISSSSTTASASTLPTSTTTVKTTVRHSNIPPPTTDHLMQVFCANKDSIQCSARGHNICGSDGKMYRNKCELSKAVCDDLSLLRATNQSTCIGVKITTSSPSTYTTSSSTTGSIPSSTSAANTTPQTTQTATTDAFCAHAAITRCPTDLDPICASDDFYFYFYLNACEFHKELCTTPSLRKEEQSVCTGRGEQIIQQNVNEK